MWDLAGGMLHVADGRGQMTRGRGQGMGDWRWQGMGDWRLEMGGGRVWEVGGRKLEVGGDGRRW
jgi:hypothetical protein